MKHAPELNSSDALLVVDVQNDFCPGGALPVEEGDQVVGILNEWIQAAVRGGVPVYFSRDWHPREHPSFRHRGGEWPVHCLQDSEGARFHPDLSVPGDAIIVTKGTRFDQDQYSAFDQTGLAEELQRRKVRRVVIGGLAEDVCVRASALEARKAGLEVALIREACRPVAPAGGAEAIDEMRGAGVAILE